MGEKIAVLGAGAWGIAIASMLAGRSGLNVQLWSRNEAVARDINESRKAKALPGCLLDGRLHVSTDAKSVLEGADVAVLVVVSFGLRGFLASSAPFWPREAKILCCTKGLEEDSCKRMTQVIQDELAFVPLDQLAVMSGPNLAGEIAMGKPASTVIASESKETARILQGIFHSESFRVYVSDDVAGVELGGAIKNVIAIAAGICHGLELGDNSVAALATRGIREISRLGAKMGAKLETLSGLAGIGDVIVTCVSKQSRNRSIGEEIGRGAPPERVLSERKSVEGIHTVKALHKLSKMHEISLPISEIVYKVLFEGFSAKDAGAVLMEREPQPENN
ncbi:MAG: NAD(P)-dependent glycerol-3-phosphate dehydrogenase [Clostridiales bacterium]|jgi:glycerol-3-phosphate dehydrogenase (NAD(P)+)|nr:NAD(P)-dependent glycerol-3-phosphate dehydrogenase [Clostridiales bacterium]